MDRFGRFYLDKEKDMIVDLFLEGDQMTYVLMTPNHRTGNLITNFAKLCSLPLSYDSEGLKVIRGDVPCYINAYNEEMYIFRLGGTKIANIFPDGRIEMKASVPAISKTLMSQTKDFHGDIATTIVKTYIRRECKFRTDLHTHMNANLSPDILIALGIRHQIRYPLYYVKKLGLKCTGAQQEALLKARAETAAHTDVSGLIGKHIDRRIDDNTFINFADLILNNIENAGWNIPRIRRSLAVMKDGQAVFTNLEKVYLYRYVFTKGIASDEKITLHDIDRIPDEDIREILGKMLADAESDAYRENSLFQNKLLWIARTYQKNGIHYAEISDTTLVKRKAAAAMLKEVHAVMPKIHEETGVRIRFLAALRRIPLTIVRDRIAPGNYLSENLQVLKSVAADPYVAGSDIVGEEINDIRDLKPLIKELTVIARKEPSFVIRIHAGENDSMKDNVANSIRCVRDSLEEGCPMPKVRIGHGLYTADLRSRKGRQLLDDIRKYNVVLEFQITSNVRLNNLNSVTRHPLKQYLASGVHCVQGTDGGALYGTDSIDEQLTLEKLLGLSFEEQEAMCAGEEEIMREAFRAFEEKAGRIGDIDAYFADMCRRQEEPLPEEHVITLFSGEKKETAHELADLVKPLPEGKIPVVIAGGSFSSENSRISLQKEPCALIDALLERGDPENMYFVIGHRLKGYEKYLTDRNQGRYEIYAFVPSQSEKQECDRLRKAGVNVRISVEAAAFGLYKSIAYEIFKQRQSVLVALAGNTPSANLVQEARNAKYRTAIYISSKARLLKEKAESLGGYITLFDEHVSAADAILDHIGSLKENRRTGV